MSRVRRWLFIPLLLIGPPLYSQQTDIGKKLEPVEAEVQLLDNSNVRMLMLHDKLEVITRFGKLVVPTSEIVKIDFGIHLPPGMERKVAQAIEELGSDNYKTREVALKTLVDLGPYAYPQVHVAAKSEQPEVAKRAAIALEKIKARHPARNLRLREDDIITTTSFPIFGRITTTSLKAKNETFGDVELKLTHLRAMHLVNPSRNTEVTVDAAKYGSVPNQWMETDFEVTAGVRLLIVATGAVNIWPQGPGYICSPRGYGTNGPSPPGTQFSAGALLGRIGDDGPAFLIGERFDGTPNRQGRLYLHIVPSPWNNASTGTYQAKIAPRGELSGD